MYAKQFIQNDVGAQCMAYDALWNTLDVYYVMAKATIENTKLADWKVKLQVVGSYIPSLAKRDYISKK